MTTAVDSAVLIDVLQEEPGWAARSADALDAASRAGRLTVCDVVWAEVAGRFGSPAEAADALSTLGIEFDPMTAPAAAAAGRLWRAFREAGGGRRDRVVADFLVGAHASTRRRPCSHGIAGSTVAISSGCASSNLVERPDHRASRLTEGAPV